MSYSGEYIRHAVLNLGQAAQGVRYAYSHPDMDARHPRGSVPHVLASLGRRLPLICNDLVYAVLPPRWHHTDAQLRVMMPVPVGQWFWHGYCTWAYTGTAAALLNLAMVDRRWDPRCKVRI
ncbi:MAG: hypothetical protein ABI832_24370 [bacterium]